MAEFVAGLSGEEIINDVLFQVKKALKKDCNLRESDSYGRGYSGKVVIHLDLFAIDATPVEATVDLKPTQELLKETPETPQDVEGSDVKVDATVEIPLNSNVDEVRKQSEQSVPMMSTEPDGSPVVRRRSYATPVVSGAVDESVV